MICEVMFETNVERGTLHDLLANLSRALNTDVTLRVGGVAGVWRYSIRDGHQTESSTQPSEPLDWPSNIQEILTENALRDLAAETAEAEEAAEVEPQPSSPATIEAWAETMAEHFMAHEPDEPVLAVDSISPAYLEVMGYDGTGGSVHYTPMLGRAAWEYNQRISSVGDQLRNQDMRNSFRGYQVAAFLRRRSIYTTPGESEYIFNNLVERYSQERQTEEADLAASIEDVPQEETPAASELPLVSPNNPLSQMLSRVVVRPRPQDSLPPRDSAAMQQQQEDRLQRLLNTPGFNVGRIHDSIFIDLPQSVANDYSHIELEMAANLYDRVMLQRSTAPVPLQPSQLLQTMNVLQQFGCEEHPDANGYPTLPSDLDRRARQLASALNELDQQFLGDRLQALNSEIGSRRQQESNPLSLGLHSLFLERTILRRVRGYLQNRLDTERGVRNRTAARNEHGEILIGWDVAGLQVYALTHWYEEAERRYQTHWQGIPAAQPERMLMEAWRFFRDRGREVSQIEALMMLSALLPMQPDYFRTWCQPMRQLLVTRYVAEADTTRRATWAPYINAMSRYHRWLLRHPASNTDECRSYSALRVTSLLALRRVMPVDAVQNMFNLGPVGPEAVDPSRLVLQQQQLNQTQRRLDELIRDGEGDSVLARQLRNGLQIMQAQVETTRQQILAGNVTPPGARGLTQETAQWMETASAAAAQAPPVVVTEGRNLGRSEEPNWEDQLRNAAPNQRGAVLSAYLTRARALSHHNTEGVVDFFSRYPRYPETGRWSATQGRRLEAAQRRFLSRDLQRLAAAFARRNVETAADVPGFTTAIVTETIEAVRTWLSAEESGVDERLFEEIRTLADNPTGLGLLLGLAQVVQETSWSRVAQVCSGLSFVSSALEKDADRYIAWMKEGDYTSAFQKAYQLVARAILGQFKCFPYDKNGQLRYRPEILFKELQNISETFQWPTRQRVALVYDALHEAFRGTSDALLFPGNGVVNVDLRRATDSRGVDSTYRRIRRPGDGEDENQQRAAAVSDGEGEDPHHVGSERRTGQPVEH